MHAKWYGFGHADQDVSYAAGLGSEPLLDDIKPFVTAENGEVLLIVPHLDFYEVTIVSA